MAAFGQAHRTHPQAREPQGTAVAGDVVRRHRGSSQDESPRVTRVIIDVASHLIPNPGHELPLVNEPGVLSCEQQGRLEQAGRSSSLVPIKSNRASRNLKGRLRLTATSRSLDENSAGCPEPRGEFGVHHAWAIVGDSA
jgi:hypothetical protein